MRHPMTDQFEQTFLLFVFGLIIVGAGGIALYLKIRALELAVESVRDNDLKCLEEKLKAGLTGLSEQMAELRAELTALRGFILETVAKVVQAAVQGAKDRG